MIGRRALLQRGLDSALLAWPGVLRAMGACGVAATAPVSGMANSAAAGVALTRRLRFQISVSNPGDQPLPAQPLWMYGPVSETANQRFKAVSCSFPLSSELDALGNSIWTLQLPALPAFGSRTATLDCTVSVWQEPEARPLAAGADWLRSERLMDLSDPALQSLALKLRRDTPRASAQAIFDWVRTELSYAGYVADDWGASVALAQRRGDCTEYAYLACALARAMGLPARVLGGYVVEQDMAPQASQYHNWAEVYLEGAWRLLDAQKEALWTPAEHYVAWRICSDRNLSPLGQAHRFVNGGAVRVRMG